MFHFVLICSQYNELRRKYIPMRLRCQPCMDAFIELITTEDEILLRKRSVYIYKPFLIRTENNYIGRTQVPLLKRPTSGIAGTHVFSALKRTTFAKGCKIWSFLPGTGFQNTLPILMFGIRRFSACADNIFEVNMGLSNQNHDKQNRSHF